VAEVVGEAEFCQDAASVGHFYLQLLHYIPVNIYRICHFVPPLVQYINHKFYISSFPALSRAKILLGGDMGEGRDGIVKERMENLKEQIIDPARLNAADRLGGPDLIVFGELHRASA